MRSAVARAGLAIVFFACGEENAPDPHPSETVPRPESFGDIQGSATPSGLEPTQLIGVFGVAHEALIAQSQLASQRAIDPLVRDFANRAIMLGPGDRQLLEAALNRLNLSETDSTDRGQLEQRTREVMLMLQAQGVDFDRAFLEAQQEVRREVLRLFDTSDICRGNPSLGSIFVPNIGAGATCGPTLDASVVVPGAQVSVGGFGCIGFGGTTFAGGPASGVTSAREFDEQALFTALRSSLLAQMSDASFLSQLLSTTATTTLP